MNPVLLLAVAGVMATLTALVFVAGTLAGLRTPAPTAPPRRMRRPLRVRRSWVVAATAGVLVFLVTGWVAAGAGVTGAAIAIPGLWFDRRSTVVIARLDALAAWTRRLADLMASGAATSLESALSRSVVLAPEPIRSEVAALGNRIGPQGTERALRAFADDLADPAADHVVMALILRHRAGGAGLATVLKDLAADIDVQVRFRRDIEADRASVRQNIRLILSVTAAMGAGTFLLARDFLAPYSTPLGQVGLAGVVGVFGLALWWIHTLTKAVVGPRTLNPSTTTPGTTTATATASTSTTPASTVPAGSAHPAARGSTSGWGRS